LHIIYITCIYITILHEPFILSETQILKISLKWMPDANFLPQFTPKIFVISFPRQTMDILDNCQLLYIFFILYLPLQSSAYKLYSPSLIFFLISLKSYIVYLSSEVFSLNANKSLSPLLLNQYRMDGLSRRAILVRSKMFA